MRFWLFILILWFPSVNIAQEPSAKFIHSDIGLNKIIYFKDLSEKQGQIISWKWNFDDGFFSNAQNPQHRFSYYGEYNVCLTIKAKNGYIDTYCKTLNIRNQSDISDIIKIYPNPSTTGLIKIDIDSAVGGAEIYTITVFDMIGNVIKQFKTSPKITEKYTIDLTNYPDGKYFINISSDNFNVTKAISVNR